MGEVGLVVTGAAGRMGSGVVRAASLTPGVRVAGACELSGAPAIGEDAGIAAGVEKLGVLVQDDLEKALDAARASGESSSDLVVVDFTSPRASIRHARIAADGKVALVVGTTGFDEAGRQAVRKAGEVVPVVMAPNMSVGVNLMLVLARKAAEALGESYDVEILEAHHRMKADAPSGTALRLGEVVSEALGRDLDEVGVFERRGDIGARTEAEIGIQTLRGGDVAGEHTVYFFGTGERVELTHRATSRDVFVQGAIRAATWLAGRPPGLYGMNDVLAL